MPPKKKGGKKKANKGESNTAKCERQQMLTEIGSLKEHLELRCEITRRAKATASQMREQVKSVKDDVVNEQQNKAAIVSEMKRKYISDTTDLTLQIDILTQKITHMEQALAESQNALFQERKEGQQRLNAKEEKIAKLQLTISHLETAFGYIVDDSFNTMQDLIHSAQAKWQIDAQLAIEREHGPLLLQNVNQTESI